MKNLPWVASISHRRFDDPDLHFLRIFDNAGKRIMYSYFEDFHDLLGVLFRFDRRVLTMDNPKILKADIKRYIPEVPYQFHHNSGELNIAQTIQIIMRRNPTFTATEICNITNLPRAVVTAAMRVKT